MKKTQWQPTIEMATHWKSRFSNLPENYLVR
jgi:hypothetical protein